MRSGATAHRFQSSILATVLMLLSRGIGNAGEDARSLAPVKEEIFEIEEYCRANGEAPRIEPDFATLVRLDADEALDLLVDDAKGGCRRGMQPRCGSGGCTVRVWLAAGSGFKPIFRHVAQSYSLSPAPGGAGMTLTIDEGPRYPPLRFRFERGCAVVLDGNAPSQCGND